MASTPLSSLYWSLVSTFTSSSILKYDRIHKRKSLTILRHTQRLLTRRSIVQEFRTLNDTGPYIGATIGVKFKTKIKDLMKTNLYRKKQVNKYNRQYLESFYHGQ